MNFESFGGRRFCITLGCGIVCTLLLIGGYIHEDVFQTITLATVAVYIGANTYQKQAQIKADGLNSND